MRKEYVVSTDSGEMYRSFSRIPLIISDHDISIRSAVRYSDARKFRSLRWATHRARYLSKSSPDLYYVYTAKCRNGICLMSLVDDTINDKLIEKNEEFEKEVNEIIESWKKKRGSKRVSHDL